MPRETPKKGVPLSPPAAAADEDEDQLASSTAEHEEPSSTSSRWQMCWTCFLENARIHQVRKADVVIGSDVKGLPSGAAEALISGYLASLSATEAWRRAPDFGQRDSTRILCFATQCLGFDPWALFNGGPHCLKVAGDHDDPYRPPNMWPEDFTEAFNRLICDNFFHFRLKELTIFIKFAVVCRTNDWRPATPLPERCKNSLEKLYHCFSSGDKSPAEVFRLISDYAAGCQILHMEVGIPGMLVLLATEEGTPPITGNSPSTTAFEVTTKDLTNLAEAVEEYHLWRYSNEFRHSFLGPVEDLTTPSLSAYMETSMVEAISDRLEKFPEVVDVDKSRFDASRKRRRDSKSPGVNAQTSAKRPQLSRSPVNENAPSQAHGSPQPIKPMTRGEWETAKIIPNTAEPISCVPSEVRNAILVGGRNLRVYEGEDYVCKPRFSQ